MFGRGGSPACNQRRNARHRHLPKSAGAAQPDARHIRLPGRHRPEVDKGILSRTGGFRPPARSRCATVLTLAEPEEISRAVVAGFSIRSIAALLGRAPSTISREIKRDGGRSGYTPAEVARVLRLRQRIGAALERFFDEFDVLLCPTAPVTAWPLDQLAPATIGGRAAGPPGHAVFTPLFNYCAVPACSVPAGRVRGLPVGLQVVAPRYEDARVLQCARLIEAVA